MVRRRAASRTIAAPCWERGRLARYAVRLDQASSSAHPGTVGEGGDETEGPLGALPEGYPRNKPVPRSVEGD